MTENHVPESDCLFQRQCRLKNSVLRVSRGTQIFSMYQRTQYVYHIHRGIVGLFRTYADGQETIDSLIQAPHLIGIAGFVGMGRKQPVYHAAQARAITPVVYCRTKREAVWDVLDDRSLRAEIMDMICGTVFDMTIRSVASDFKMRVMIVLDMLARSVGVKDSRGEIAISGITHDDIACVTRVTRPTVSRVLEQLEERDVIQIGRRNIVVRQPELLRNETQIKDTFDWAPLCDW